MKTNLFFKILLYVFVCSTTYASSKTIFSDYDLRFYHPENYGLKDLVFEIRIENLTNELNMTKSYGKLEDVYFKIYWMFPGQYNIVINGLPQGFKELRRSLKEQVKSRLLYVIPKAITPLLRSFDLSQTTSSIKATPKSKQAKIKSIDFTFNKDGQILTMKTTGEYISILTKYKHETPIWSNKKWVLKQVVEERMQGRHRLTMKSEIQYKKFQKYGFPKKISITTTPYIDQGKVNKKTDKRSILTSLEFSNYEVNTGKAKKVITGTVKN